MPVVTTITVQKSTMFYTSLSHGCTKANKPPIRYSTTLTIYTVLAVLRVFKQASRKAGSIGQGALRFRHCNTPLPIIIKPAKPNSSVLCSLNQTTCGNIDTRDESAAPAPRATSKAGIAQHTNVLELAKRLAKDDQRPLRDSVMPSALIYGSLIQP